MNDIKKNTIVYGLRQIFLFVMSFLINMYTTRKLTNEDFGYLVYYNTIVAAFGFITDGSLWAGFVQDSKEITKSVLNKMFTFIISISSLIVILAFLYIHLFQSKENNKNFLIYFSLIAIISTAFQSIIYTKFQKDLKISYIALCDIISSLVYYVLVILLLQLQLGFFAILWSMTIKILINLLLAFLFCKAFFKFDFRWNDKDFMINLRRGGVNLLSFPVNYSRTLMNPVIVGNFCNLGAMGIIDRSVLIAGIPSNVLTVALQKVLFPVFSNTYNNKKDLKSQVTKSVFYASVLDKLYYIPLIILIKDAVGLFFGEKWNGMVIPIYILSFGNMLWGSLAGVCNICLLSTAKFKENFFINLFSTIIVIPLTVGITYFFGINGYCLCSIILWISVYVVLKIVNNEIKIGNLLYEYLLPFIIALFTILFISLIFFNSNISWLNCFIKVIISYVLYGVLLIVFDKKYIREMIQTIWKQKRI